MKAIYALIAFTVMILIFVVSVAQAETGFTAVPGGSECYEVISENPMVIKFGTVVNGRCVT